MTDQAPFFDAIRDATVGDNSPAWIYADWLEERGEHARAGMIRLSLELERCSPWHPRHAALSTQRDALAPEVARAWSRALPPDPPRGPAEWSWEGGLPTRLTLPAVSPGAAERDWLGEASLATPLRSLTVRPGIADETARAAQDWAGAPEIGVARRLVLHDAHPKVARAWLHSRHLTALRGLNLHRPARGAKGAWSGVLSGPPAARLEWLRVDGSREAAGVGWLNLPALPSLKSLGGLELAHTRLEADAAAALSAVLAAGALESLHLSNALAPEVEAAPIRPALSDRLRAFHLTGGQRGGDFAAMIADRSPAGLGELGLVQCQVDDAGVAALLGPGRPPSLSRLRLAGNPIRLERAPESGPGLELLDMGFCELGPAGARSLAASGAIRGLAELNLTRNPLGDDGAEAIAALDDCAGLRSLGLSDVRLTARGVLALVASRSLAALGSLALGGNALGDAGATAIARGTGWPALRELGVSSNRIGDAGAASLAGRAVAGDWTFLDLSRNKITEAAVSALAEALESAPRLTIDLRNNPIPEPAAEQLRRRFGPRVLASEPRPARLSGLLE
jgi:uncharacterized protein (TIGR02996 family)